MQELIYIIQVCEKHEENFKKNTIIVESRDYALLPLLYDISARQPLSQKWGL